MVAAGKLFICCVSTLNIFMNRKKTILFTVQVIIVLLASFLGYKIWSISKSKEKLIAVTQHLPSIQFRKIDGSIFNSDSVNANEQFLVFNYFNPGCEHCQNMVKEMHAEKNLLDTVSWIMITAAPKSATKAFYDSMRLNELPNVTVVLDTAYNFIQTFGSGGVPSFYVYRDKKLVRKHSGECSIHYLLGLK